MAKILIIDDDADMRLAARLCLESGGYEVIEASNTQAGQAALTSQHPDLIILDVMMDSTTEGFQFALRLRGASPTSDIAAFKHIPIIMMTAIHSTTPLRFGPDQDYLPVDVFIDKPLDPDKLLALVRQLLEKVHS